MHAVRPGLCEWTFLELINVGAGVVLGMSGIVVIALGQLSEPNSSYLLIIGYSLLLFYAASKGTWEPLFLSMD